MSISRSCAAFWLLLSVLLPARLWAQISWTCATESAPWTPRVFSAAVYFHGRIWVLGGGRSDERVMNDVWSSPDGRDWTKVADSAPWPARTGHSAVVCRDSIWLFGGRDLGRYYADVWKSGDAVQWNRATDSAGWSARIGFGAAVLNDTVWLTGGYDGTRPFCNDVWKSGDGILWIRVTPAALWTFRGGHGLVVFDGKAWIMGGYDGIDLFNDVWRSANGANWVCADTASWSPRYALTAVVHDGKIWVCGGNDLLSPVNDVWYSDSGTRWTQVRDSVAWPARMGHMSVASDSGIWIMGGIDTSNLTLRDVWRSVPSTGIQQMNPGKDQGLHIADCGLRTAPNPFRERLDVAFSPAAATGVRLAVYDAAGREIRRFSDLTAAQGRVSWDGRYQSGGKAPAGAYFVRLVYGGRVVQRVVLKLGR